MNYYQVLELSENATMADIRRAYRRLVFHTHPDRTPDPEAHARYYDITAAYEVLSDPTRRYVYDTGMQPMGDAFTRTTPTGRIRAAPRTAAAANRARPRPTPLRVHYAVGYAKSYGWALRLARPLLIASVLLCASLALDYVLAGKQLETVLGTETTFYDTNRGSYQKTLHRTNRGTFMLYNDLDVGDRVLVKRTPIWGTATSVRSSARQEPPYPISSVYEGNRKYLWLGLLLTASLGLAPRLTNNLRILAGLAALIFMVLTLLQLFL